MTLSLNMGQYTDVGDGLTGSRGLTGWHLRTNLRCAVLIAAEVASLVTPRASYGSGGNGDPMMVAQWSKVSRAGQADRALKYKMQRQSLGLKWLDSGTLRSHGLGGKSDAGRRARIYAGV